MQASATEFTVNLAKVLRHSWNPHPDEVVAAVNDELLPLAEFVRTHAPGFDAEAVLWIAMELVTNAVNALFSHALSARTGASRSELLGVFKANPLWSDASLKRLARSSGSPVEIVLEKALGMGVEEFLRKPQIEKFRIAGVFDLPHDVAVTCIARGSPVAVAVEVASPVPPSMEDMREIEARFMRFEETKSAVLRMREGAKDGTGMFWLPSFTGGGGMGLLACIGRAREAGLELRFLRGEAAAGRTVFRLEQTS